MAFLRTGMVVTAAAVVAVSAAGTTAPLGAMGPAYEVLPWSAVTLSSADAAVTLQGTQAVGSPGTVFGRAAALPGAPDPFYGLNLQNSPAYAPAQFVGPGRVPWNYSTTVDAAAVAGAALALLELDGINYRARVFADGVQLRSLDNETDLVGTFRSFRLPIPQPVAAAAAQAGRPLRVDLQVWPPVDEWHPPSNNSTDLAISFMDWNPAPPDASMGMWRPARLITWPATASHAAASSDANTSTEGSDISSLPRAAGATLPMLRLEFPAAYTRVAADRRSANVTPTVGVRWLGGGGSAPAANLSCTLRGPGERAWTVWSLMNFKEGPLVTAELPQFTVEGADLQLWWPWHMLAPDTEEPFVYGVTCAATAVQAVEGSGADAAVLDVVNATIGLREVTSELNEQGYLALRVNGRPLLVLGAGYTPRLDLRPASKFEAAREFALVKRMGLNTVRLEGKLPSDEWFAAADAAGVMVVPGLECCDAWQHWSAWDAHTTAVANESVATLAARLRGHPSMLMFAYSSDELPPPTVEQAYRRALRSAAWPNPELASCSNLTSELTGDPTGVKMSGPYNWVPPDYWYLSTPEVIPSGSDSPLGGAFGFLTEGGPGASPLVPRSWEATVPADVAAQWPPNSSSKAYWAAHCANPQGLFGTLDHFTTALRARYGPAATEATARQFLLAGQVASYETRRAMLEAYCRNKRRGATGMVMWMLNNAHVSHMWNTFDFFGRAGGSFHGPMRATRHYTSAPYYVQAIFAHDDQSVYILTSPLFNASALPPSLELRVRTFAPNGAVLSASTTPLDASTWHSDDAVKVGHVDYPTGDGQGAFYAELVVAAVAAAVVDRAVYWLAANDDVLDWSASNFFSTPVKQYGDLSSLAEDACDLASLYWRAQAPADNRTVSVELTAAPKATCVHFGLFLEVVVGAGNVSRSTADSQYSRYEFVFDENLLALFPGQTLVVGAALLGPTDAVAPPSLEVCVSTFASAGGAPVCRGVATAA